MMLIRQAKYRELEAAVNVCSAAFFDEEVVGDIMHPYRYLYPEDVKLYWRRRLREQWPDWKCRFYVCIVRCYDGEQRESGEEVVGFSIWKRQGDGASELELRWGDPRRIAAPIARLVNNISQLVHPNRAANPANEDIWNRLVPYIKQYWSGDRGDGWFLDVLAVHPEHQRKGYGSALVKDGLSWVKNEGVGASVVSSRGNEMFYQRCGFGEIVGWASEGENNPVAHVEGGAIMFMDRLDGLKP